MWKAGGSSLPISISEHKEFRGDELDLMPHKPYAPAWMERSPAIYLRHHVLEGIHDLGAFCLLVVGEAAGDDDHSCQHHTQI